MDSFGSSPGSGSGSGQPNAEAIMSQLQNQLAQAYAEELVETLRGKCFDKCIAKPGSSLSGSEGSCISRCVDRYLEATGDYAEEDPQILRQKASSKPELGEPVIMRCQPYKIPLTELLLPHKISPVEYFRLWPSLPAIVEYTGTYTYKGSGFMATAAKQYDASPFLSGLKSLDTKPFHKVCSHIIRTVAGFQLCYAAKTWHGGFLWMMIFGASEVSRNVDLGDETTTMMCKFVVRASDASITKDFESDLQGWLDDLTDGGCEYMPEDEVKSAASERLKTSLERLALLKAAKPRPKIGDSDSEEEERSSDDEFDDEEKERRRKKRKEERKKRKEEREKKKKEEEEERIKGPSTLSKLSAEEVEHLALQAAVIQEWHMLCKDRDVKVY